MEACQLKALSWLKSFYSALFGVKLFFCFCLSHPPVKAAVLPFSSFFQASSRIYIYIYIFFFLTNILKCNGAGWWLLTRLLWLSSVAHPCDSWSLLSEIPNKICDLPKIFNTVLLDW